jgi:hypothetical protein
MSSSIARALKFMRARWRWMRGRCPRCDRDLYGAFPYCMGDDPHCFVCQDETQLDLRVWHKYRSLEVGLQPAVVRVVVRVME